MAKISIATMHCPHDMKRAGWVKSQTNQIKEEWNASLLSHIVVNDYSKKGVWNVARRAWQAYDGRATHLVLLQDDQLLCKNFISNITSISSVLPDEVISFYSQRHSDMDRCKENDIRWFINSDGVYGGAVMMPVEVWDRALEWCDENLDERYPYDDGRLAIFLSIHGIKVWNTAPSLVFHLGHSSSLIGHNNSENKTNWFADEKEIDWSDLKTIQAKNNLNLEEELAKARKPTLLART